nr:Virulence protein RhuM family [uncultured bacterium]
MKLRAEEGTVWLTRSEIAELFQTTPQNITLHIQGIYEENEADPASTSKDYLLVQMEGNRNIQREVKLYNLSIILASGYRVRSARGIQFRKWATAHLQEYLVKGFILDDARLKEQANWDYFDELLERIREIRASEKKFYQKVKDIYATAVDYDTKSESAQFFFKKVQNKMLWALTGHTAAELICHRANPQLPNMGLTSWKGGRVRQSDVTVAKNYLSQEELNELKKAYPNKVDLQTLFLLLHHSNIFVLLS